MSLFASQKERTAYSTGTIPDCELDEHTYSNSVLVNRGVTHPDSAGLAGETRRTRKGKKGVD